MKKEGLREGDMRAEYDFEALGPGVRGKYYVRMMAKSNVVRIAADLTKAFPNERAVNDALRQLLEIREIAERKPVNRRRRAAR